MNSAFTDAKTYIIESWGKHFEEKRDTKLAIYGIGKYTEAILDSFPSGHVVALMDGTRSEGTIYGRPIVTVEEAVSLGVGAIVIVAQANNVRIIYRRIADACAAHSIDIYDINGGIVTFDRQKSFAKYAEISEQRLKEKIDRADVVSFDIFDTLIMRRTLYPRDIFALAGRQIGSDFYERRVNAETALYDEGKNPNIYDIYERIGGVSPDIELALESQFLIRRESMVKMLQYAREAGKTVYFLSDMYLPGHIMKNKLGELGIQIEAENLLVSCDYGAFKINGLFGVLRSLVGAKKILHVGDNDDADIASAKRYGIDDTFHIEKSQIMLEDSYASEIFKYDNSLPNRLLIGEFIGRLLNDPFLFSKTGGKFLIGSTYEMSYSLIAPLVYCFFGWLTRQARELKLDLILLSSRDGFIIERIYEIFKARDANLPPMVYFYLSRAAAMPASILDDEDIRYVTGYFYGGGTEEMLMRRFGMDEEDLLPRREDWSDEDYVMLHRAVIIRQAEEIRQKYKTYIGKFGIPRGAKVGFFDFVSAGTCLKALSNFADFDLTGLFFAVNDGHKSEYNSSVTALSMFGSLNPIERSYNIMPNYLFLENIFTSYEPTLASFDDDGNPIFMEERRSPRQMQALREIHAAIIDYVKNSKIELLDICEVEKAVPDLLLKLFQQQYSQIDTDYFDNAEFIDEFRNLTSNFSDVVK